MIDKEHKEYFFTWQDTLLVLEDAASRGGEVTLLDQEVLAMTIAIPNIVMYWNVMDAYGVTHECASFPRPGEITYFQNIIETKIIPAAWRRSEVTLSPEEASFVVAYLKFFSHQVMPILVKNPDFLEYVRKIAQELGRYTDGEEF